MAGTYAVVLTDPEIQDADRLQKIGQAVAEVRGCPAYDGVSLAKKSRGILDSELEYREAEAVAAALRKQGIDAFAVDASGVLPAPQPRRIRAVDLGSGVFKAQTGYAGMENIPWERVALASACFYRMPVQKIVLPKGGGGGRMMLGVGAGLGLGMATGSFGSVRRAVKKYKESSKVKTISRRPGEGEFYVADIHLRNPGQVLRIHSKECRYDYLGERGFIYSEQNFQQVLGDLQEIGGVLLSPMASQLADGHDLSDRVVENLHLFERYNSWLFLIAMAFEKTRSGQPEEEIESLGNLEESGIEGERNRSVQDDFEF